MEIDAVTISTTEYKRLIKSENERELLRGKTFFINTYYNNNLDLTEICALDRDEANKLTEHSFKQEYDKIKKKYHDSLDLINKYKETFSEITPDDECDKKYKKTWFGLYKKRNE